MTADVVVIGAGGHAKVCVEILQSMGERVAFCVADGDSPLRCASELKFCSATHIWQNSPRRATGGSLWPWEKT